MNTSMERAIRDARTRRRTPHLLRNITIKRVDLVDAGSNYDLETGEGSHVLLWKRADGPVSQPIRPDRQPADPLSLKRAARFMRRRLIERGALPPEATDQDVLSALGWNRKGKDKTMWHFSGAKGAEGRVRKYFPAARREGLADTRRAQVAKIAATEYRAGGPLAKGVSRAERDELERLDPYAVEAAIAAEMARRGARDADIRDVLRGGEITDTLNGRNPSRGRARGEAVFPRTTAWGLLERGQP